jgi:hypothetical protein
MAKTPGFPPLFGIFALLIGALQIVSTLTFDSVAAKFAFGLLCVWGGVILWARRRRAA